MLSSTSTSCRRVLPIPEPSYPHSTVLDARDATAPPRFEVKAPAGAPNVPIVLVDDMGFGIPSAFGGPVHMPAADRLASSGLRYNQFHTTALCSPTRTALLSGRNHHMNNMGSITETATAFPGNTGQRPNNVAPLAEMLRLNGCSTAFFGKNHETAPWEKTPRRKLQEDIWELYDTSTDFSLANDLAAKNPSKLKEMQDLFLQEAVKYRVLPIDDRLLERIIPATAGRPDLIGDRTSLTLSVGMDSMSENVFINIKNRWVSITVEVEIPQGGANGVILAQGGRFGGWSLYLEGGKPTYCYNFLGLERYKVAAAQAVAAGKATIRMNFDYDGCGVGKGGTATLLLNGEKVASGRVERTQMAIFSADETAGVGVDDATPVTSDYAESDNAFTGTILKVTVDVKPIGAAVKAEEDAAKRETAVQKAISD
jgi:hypothetical protein